MLLLLFSGDFDSSNSHCVKCVQIRSYFWSVFSCIRTEYRKIRTRNNSAFGHFSRSVFVLECFNCSHALRMSIWYFHLPFAFNWDTTTHMKIMTPWYHKTIFSNNITMLQYWVYWYIIKHATRRNKPIRSDLVPILKNASNSMKTVTMNNYYMMLIMLNFNEQLNIIVSDYANKICSLTLHSNLVAKIKSSSISMKFGTTNN